MLPLLQLSLLSAFSVICYFIAIYVICKCHEEFTLLLAFMWIILTALLICGLSVLCYFFHGVGGTESFFLVFFLLLH
jgi:hypothetical protein